MRSIEPVISVRPRVAKRCGSSSIFSGKVSLIFTIFLQNLEEVIDDIVIYNIESGIIIEVLRNEFNVVIELVSYHRDIAVAKDKMTDSADDHDTEKESDWENGRDTGVGVVRK